MVLRRRRDEIALRADSDRKLRIGDASGRELLISCGAALMNVRLALRVLGYEPQVRVLPDPDRPALLATVRLAAAVAADEENRLLHAEIERRRTHRAGFTDLPVPERLVEALVAEASTEGARLTPVRSEPALWRHAAGPEEMCAPPIPTRPGSPGIGAWLDSGRDALAEPLP